MKILFSTLLIFVPLSCMGQADQAIMEVRVNVIKGATNTAKKITIPYKNTVQKDTTFITQGSNNTVPVDSLLFFSYNSYPNTDIIISVQPVHHFENEDGQQMTFVIDAMGYSYVPQKSHITYFDTYNCNTVRTNKDGKAYLWVDGRLKLPEGDIEGSFVPTLGGNIQCSSL